MEEVLWGHISGHILSCQSQPVLENGSTTGGFEMSRLSGLENYHNADRKPDLPRFKYPSHLAALFTHVKNQPDPINKTALRLIVGLGLPSAWPSFGEILPSSILPKRRAWEDHESLRQTRGAPPFIKTLPGVFKMLYVPLRHPGGFDEPRQLMDREAPCGHTRSSSALAEVPGTGSESSVIPYKPQERSRILMRKLGSVAAVQSTTCLKDVGDPINDESCPSPSLTWYGPWSHLRSHTLSGTLIVTDDPAIPLSLLHSGHTLIQTLPNTALISPEVSRAVYQGQRTEGHFTTNWTTIARGAAYKFASPPGICLGPGKGFFLGCSCTVPPIDFPCQRCVRSIVCGAAWPFLDRHSDRLFCNNAKNELLVPAKRVAAGQTARPDLIHYPEHRQLQHRSNSRQFSGPRAPTGAGKSGSSYLVCRFEWKLRGIVTPQQPARYH
ncbi:hypothetical protein Bbelb_090790 [Branchiostoma belcheri]|nr:hypothetical protein Bbelb_090790 [Branchiostoma belcheri]